MTTTAQLNIVRDILNAVANDVGVWGLPDRFANKYSLDEWLEAIEAVLTRLQLAEEQDGV
jgi:hypothetical protein